MGSKTPCRWVSAETPETEGPGVSTGPRACVLRATGYRPPAFGTASVSGNSVTTV